MPDADPAAVGALGRAQGASIAVRNVSMLCMQTGSDDDTVSGFLTYLRRDTICIPSCHLGTHNHSPGGIRLSQERGQTTVELGDELRRRLLKANIALVVRRGIVRHLGMG